MQFNPSLINVSSGSYNSRYGHSKQPLDVVQDKVGKNVAKETGVAAPAQSSGLKIGEKKSAEDVAKTMLDHVTRGLESLKSQGADPERLQQRLDAAKEGIARGYKEAEQQLKDLGLLDDDLSGEIQKGKDLISAGIADIEAGIQGLAAPDSEEAPESNGNLLQGVSGGQISSQFRNENSFSLEVVTRDGDRVNVSFSQVHQSSAFAATDGQNSVFASSTQSGFLWQLDVEGDLDEGEQEALSALLQDVEQLSNSFFSGDLGSALEQATELGFDGNELASLSLNLRQTSFSSVTQAYNSVQPAQLPTSELNDLAGSLLAYNDDYFAALDKAGLFEEPRQLLNDLVDQLLPEEKLKDIFQAYNDGLVNAVAQRDALLQEAQV